MKQQPLALLACLWMSLPLHAQVKREVWGATPDGKPVSMFTLQEGKLRVQITGFGARIVSVETPDRTGKHADIALGFNNLAQYVAATKGYFGATIGRYANRIPAGTFTLDGMTYHVPPNAKGNALHGGTEGFDRKVWRGRIVGKKKVEFTLTSPDGDMGFPGELKVEITYTLEADRLRLEYQATTTKSTVLNLTNHSYFNLAGEGSGDVLQQQLRIDAESVTPVGPTLLPSGALMPVAGTPFDFRPQTAIGARLEGTGSDTDEQLRLAAGYDHSYGLHGSAGQLREAAYAIDPGSGRSLTVLTTEPGLQFYSGNVLDGSQVGYSGVPYRKHAAFCLETQHFPDSPNHPGFPSTVLRPGKTFHSTTVLVFGISRN